MRNLSRRRFMKAGITAVTSAAAFPAVTSACQGATPPTAAPDPSKNRKLPEPSPAALPRWRGFNLTEKFLAKKNQRFVEADFAWMAEWGFDFARLPMSYRCWTPDPRKWREVDEKVLAEIDEAIRWGQQYGIHVNLNFHRAPGHCVNQEVAEPFDLWKDAEALEACAYQWRLVAQRYRDIPNSRVSFNPLNEPINPAADDLLRVYKGLIAAIREGDPKRLLIIDGTRWSRVPVPLPAEAGVAQASHVYDPIQVCFWRMPGIPNSDRWPKPSWPLTIRDQDPAWDGYWDRRRLEKVCIEPFRKLESTGVGIHVSEIGCHNKTPHAVVLAWYTDCLSLWRQAGWGWAPWNFRGPFGVLDSERDDVSYENWRGHKLDRALLELLRRDGAE
jgi:endoglucanase